MKRLLVCLSILIFLFVVSFMVHADWVSDIPIEKDIIYIGLHFDGDDGIVTLKTKTGICKNYRVVSGEITQMKNCNEKIWKEFVKEENNN